jgi:hypothetical protein
VEADGSLVVVDRSLEAGGRTAVVRVNAITGDRTVLSGCAVVDRESLSCSASIGTGPPLEFPEAIAVEADGSLVVVDGPAVVRVNPVTGDRTAVSRFDRETNMNIGNGPLLVSLEDIAVEADGSLIVVDTALAAVVRVDPLTGDRTIISR